MVLSIAMCTILPPIYKGFNDPYVQHIHSGCKTIEMIYYIKCNFKVN